MNGIVENYIRDLLYNEKTVVVPGLGAFLANYQNATIDTVQGKLHPPSKQLKFNPNITINDGQLVDAIVKGEQCSTSEANAKIEDFANQCKLAFDKKEIFVIPSIGRLFLDIEKNIQFVPDSTNFNLDAYALPALQFYPIVRSRPIEQVQKISEPIRTASAKTIRKKEKKAFAWRKYAAAASVALMLGFGVYIFGMDGFQKPTASFDVLSPETKAVQLNQAPKEEDYKPISKIIDENPAILSEDLAGDGSIVEDTDAPTPPTDTEECIIIVYQLSSPEGIKAANQKIAELGYDHYNKKMPSGLTRIGIRFDKNRLDKGDVMKEARISFDKGAWFLTD